MPLPLSVLDERLNAVIVQAGLISHMERPDLQVGTLRLFSRLRRAVRNRSLSVSRNEAPRARLSLLTRSNTSSSRVTVVRMLMMTLRIAHSPIRIRSRDRETHVLTLEKTRLPHTTFGR